MTARIGWQPGGHLRATGSRSSLVGLIGLTAVGQVMTLAHITAITWVLKTEECAAFLAVVAVASTLAGLASGAFARSAYVDISRCLATQRSEELRATVTRAVRGAACVAVGLVGISTGIMVVTDAAFTSIPRAWPALATLIACAMASSWANIVGDLLRSLGQPGKRVEVDTKYVRLPKLVIVVGLSGVLGVDSILAIEAAFSTLSAAILFRHLQMALRGVSRNCDSACGSPSNATRSCGRVAHGLTGVVTALQGQAETFVVAAMGDPRSVVAFGLASRLVACTQMFSNSVYSIFAARFGRAWFAGHIVASQKLFNRAGLCLVGLLAFALGEGALVGSLALPALGDEFAIAVDCLMVLLAARLVIAGLGPVGQVVLVVGRAWAQTWVACVCAAITVSLVGAGLHWFGSVGAATGVMLGGLLTSASQTLMVRSESGLMSPIGACLPLMACGLFAIGMAVIAPPCLSDDMARWCVIAVAMMAYPWVCWLALPKAYSLAVARRVRICAGKIWQKPAR